MGNKRRALLVKIYKTAVEAKTFLGRTTFSIDDYLEERFNFEYLRTKGYISYIEPGTSSETIEASITTEGVDFIEAIEDIVPDYWNK